MPDNPEFEEVRTFLHEATLRMKSLEERIQRGEDVPEEELNAVAKAVADSLMDANDIMRGMFGPEAQAEVEARMISEMSEEEYREWSEGYAARELRRETRRKEREAGSNG